jgi:hypothetical protein
MNIKLLQLEARVRELETLADRIADLAKRLTLSLDAQPELSMKGQAWFRGAREFLVQQSSSALEELDACYRYYVQTHVIPMTRAHTDLEQYFVISARVASQDRYNLFSELFLKARSFGSGYG